MHQQIHRFFQAARGAGVRVSPAESIDAMRAVAEVGFADRTILHDTLMLVMAKTQEEKVALSDCFNLFFKTPDIVSEPENDDDATRDDNETDANQQQSMAGGQPGEAGGLGSLAQLLMSQDRTDLMTALSEAASAAKLTEIRFFTQRGIYSSKIMHELGMRKLSDEIDALEGSNPALAEKLTKASDAVRDAVRDMVAHALVLYGREESENMRNDALRSAPLTQLDLRQVDQMRTLIRQMARRLRERFSRPRKRQRRGQLDVRKTIRRNASWGGVPFLTSWKRRHRDRPKVVAICDVSGSVARVSDFFLLLLYSLNEVVSDVRSFAFSSELIEVSSILDKQNAQDAMAEIMSKVGYGSSDYGNSFADFEDDFMSTVTPQTTVIILGDARTNKLDPRADILRRISERAKRVVWLNPEGRVGWGFGDSEMLRYATFCNVVRQCSTAKQLERAITDIVESYQ